MRRSIVVTIKLIVQATPDGQFARTNDDKPWIVREVGECVEQITDGCPVIIDHATWCKLGRRPLPKSTILLVDDRTCSYEVGSNTVICPTIDSALNTSRITAKELGVGIIFTLGDHVTFDRLFYRADQVLAIEIANDELGNGHLIPNLSNRFEITNTGEWMFTPETGDFRIVEWDRRR